MLQESLGEIAEVHRHHLSASSPGGAGLRLGLGAVKVWDKGIEVDESGEESTVTRRVVGMPEIPLAAACELLLVRCRMPGWWRARLSAG